MTQDKISRQSGERVVVADLSALVASLAKDPTFYVGPGGKGEIKGRVAGATEFISEARTTEKAVHMPRLGLKSGGEASVADGRHRIEALRRIFTPPPGSLNVIPSTFQSLGYFNLNFRSLLVYTPSSFCAGATSRFSAHPWP